MTELALAVVFGVGIGLSLGTLGGGGSILAVPALVYGLGLPVTQAVPTSLLVVGLTAAAGAVAHVRRGDVWMRTAAAFAAAGIVGSFAGAAAGRRVDDAVILGGLAVLMVVASVGMWRRARREPTVPVGAVAVAPAGTVALVDRAVLARLPKTLAVGFALGVLTGLFGVGGGFLVVPAMVLLLGVPTEPAIGTSLVVIAVNALAGFVAHLGMGSIDLPVTVAFAAGGGAGAFAGQMVGERFSSAALARAFAVLVLAVGSYTLFDVVKGR